MAIGVERVRSLNIERVENGGFIVVEGAIHRLESVEAGRRWAFSPNDVGGACLLLKMLLVRAHEDKDGEIHCTFCGHPVAAHTQHIPAPNGWCALCDCHGKHGKT